MCTRYTNLSDIADPQEVAKIQPRFDRRRCFEIDSQRSANTMHRVVLSLSVPAHNIEIMPWLLLRRTSTKHIVVESEMVEASPGCGPRNSMECKNCARSITLILSLKHHRRNCIEDQRAYNTRSLIYDGTSCRSSILLQHHNARFWDIALGSIIVALGMTFTN